MQGETKAEFFPKQQLYINWWFNHTTTEVNEVLFGGAAGGGKSVVGCSAIILACLRYEGSRWALCRARLSILKQTTLVTFYECCKRYGFERGVHYKVNDQRNEITFFNGSMVLLKDLFAYPSDRDFDSLGSLEINGAFVDELPQVVQRAYSVLSSRMRYELHKWCECGALNEHNEVIELNEHGNPSKWKCKECGEENTGLRPKLGAGCNPSRGWVYSEFYKPKITKKLPKERQVIFSYVTDNFKISKHYIDQLNRLPKLDRERLMLGNWEYSDDSNLFDISRVQDFLTSEASRKGERFFMSVDVARMGKDQSVIIVMSEKLVIVKVFKFEKIKTNVLAKKIIKIAEHYGIDEYDIAIDTDGVGGGVADHFDGGTTEIMNNAKPLNGENYVNLKTQLYFKLAELINEGDITTAKGAFSDSEAEELAKELEPVKRTNIDKDAKISMTSKSEIKQILQRSPDYSDALAYLMYFVIEERMNDEIISI